MDAMGFMADICRVDEGVGKLSPVWEKKRSKMRQEATSFFEMQRALKSNTHNESTHTLLSSSRTPATLVEIGGGSPDRMASFINPYLKKGKETNAMIVQEEEEEDDEGVV